MAETSLDREIDRLYGLPLGEFTKERDALARRLRAEGKRDEAAEIGALRKPVLAAWVVNRLARERRDDVRALVDAAEGIRKGKADADERFRAAADDLVRAGRDLLAAEGRKATDAVVRDVATTIRSAAATDPGLLAGGRLTEPVEATGFEAMAGAVPGPAARRPARAPSRDDRKAEKARVDEARAAVAAARQEARSLRRDADRAEREARRASAEADAADGRVAEAEERLARLRRGPAGG